MRMLSLILLGLVAATQLSVTEAAGCNRIVCYTTNWSQYRQGSGKFFPDNIDPNLCTHMVYAFAKLSGNALAAFEWNDDSTDWSVGLYEKFMNLRHTNPSAKMLLAVGGWNLGSAPFHQIAQSASNRQAFGKQAAKFLRDRGFDGLDLDWEYPANRGSPPEDKQNFISLIMDIKAAFAAEAAASNKPQLMLTAAVAAGKPNIDTAYDIPTMSRELDYISLMSYDLHGSWETFTGHNSALYARADETGDNRNLNIDWAANYWVQKGCDKNKLNIGMGLYGRSFTLQSASHFGMGAQAPKGGEAGQFTREAGFIAYYEVCDMIKAGAVVEFDNEGRVPYVHKDTQWVGYDNPASLREKVRYVKEHQFGGVMVWALPLDDFNGQHCGEGPYPLMHAINDECGHTTGSLATQPPQQTTNAPQHTTLAPGHTQNPQHTTAQPVTPAPTHTVAHTDNFACPDKDGFYPSSSCYEYYICAGHVSYSVKCAAGLVFNPNSGFCDWPANYHCTLGDVTSTQAAHTTHANQQHTNPPQQTTSQPFSGNVDTFCSNGHADGIFADPSDCAHFIECANGATFREPCGPGTAWNDNIKTCDRMEAAHCDHTA